MELTSYGSITNDFRCMAQMVKLRNKIISGEITETRQDCFDVAGNVPPSLVDWIKSKLSDCHLRHNGKMEVFYPREKYPCHVDSGEVSFFIALQPGNFFISNVSYPIVPFVLYSFDDGKPHNSDFMSIMIK